MNLKHIRVRNFRGIKEMDWHIDGRIICMVGPGDSTKTTILDAIELTLLPRGYVSLSDCDFHKGNIEAPIIIEITIGDVPAELRTDENTAFICGATTTRDSSRTSPLMASNPS